MSQSCGIRCSLSLRYFSHLLATLSSQVPFVPCLVCCSPSSQLPSTLRPSLSTILCATQSPLLLSFASESDIWVLKQWFPFCWGVEERNKPLEEKCTTLENLKPDIRNRFVKVLVSENSPISFLKWGRQQKLVFIDKENGTMQGIIYDQDVEQLDKLLQLYKTYYVRNAKVKEITRNTSVFASAKYQMLLSRSTYVRLANEEEQLPTDHAYQLTTFAQCPELADVSSKQIS
ncbi:uncharacterized protein LOC142531517 [Primulina tabacum]|uniref:uncharacterized protein LOC142531517 n=1 Tax=Primulina tabacum TaxID=48773 RepID=UPI003F591A30